MKQRKIVSCMVAGLAIIAILGPTVLNIKKDQQSNALAVTRITPKEGPTVGGNTIVVEGNDFLRRVTVEEISVGGKVTCLLSSEQWVYCWGHNFYGAVGNGQGGAGGLNPGAQEYITAPQAIARGEILDGVKIKQISSGTHVVYAIGTDNQIYYWGAKQFSPRRLSSAYPASQLPNGVLPVKIQAGHYGLLDREAIVLGSDNKVYVWNVGGSGSLSSIPAGQISSAEKIVDIAISKNATGVVCALTDLGKAYCSANNAPFTAVPQGQIPADAKITSISIASASGSSGLVPEPLNNTCVLTAAGQAYCWGTMGVDGINNYHATPTLVKMPQNKKVKKIKTGNMHICLIGSDDQAYCWSNKNNQIANGTGVDMATSSPRQPNPVVSGQIPAGVKIIDIDVNSSNHEEFETCAIGDNKKAYCWGGNYNGQSQLDGQLITQDSWHGSPINQPTLVPFGTDDETKVTIDGMQVPVKIIDKQHLEIVAPPHAPGKVDIVVMNNTADVVTLTRAYTYVKNVSPQPSQPQPNNSGNLTNNISNNSTLVPNSGYQKRDYRIILGVLISGVVLLVIGLISFCRKKLKNN